MALLEVRLISVIPVKHRRSSQNRCHGLIKCHTFYGMRHDFSFFPTSSFCNEALDTFAQRNGVPEYSSLSIYNLSIYKYTHTYHGQCMMTRIQGWRLRSTDLRSDSSHCKPHTHTGTFIYDTTEAGPFSRAITHSTHTEGRSH